MTQTTTDITCTLAEFYAAIEKDASRIQLEELHVIHQILKKILGGALIAASLMTINETQLCITLDNQKLPTPIHTVQELAEMFHSWRQMLLDTATDETSSYRDKQKIKPSLKNLAKLNDEEAQEVCEQWELRPKQSDGYRFEGVASTELHLDAQKTPCLTHISFRWQGQVIKCAVTEAFWLEVGDEMEALLIAYLHSNVHKLTFHVSGYRTKLGKYQKMELISIEQG